MSLPDGYSSGFSDQACRFAVWAGDFGAHKADASSLDFRLRDASITKSHVVEVLRQLQQFFEEAVAILQGKLVDEDQGADNGEEDASSSFAVEDHRAEMEDIILCVTHMVDNLIRLSSTIRNPAPRDFLLGSIKPSTISTKERDIQHVQMEFRAWVSGLQRDWEEQSLIGETISSIRNVAARCRAMPIRMISWGVDKLFHLFQTGRALRTAILLRKMDIIALILGHIHRLPHLTSPPSYY